MAEIKCPNCGTVISLEQSDLDSVVRQVRDEQFARDLDERMALVEEAKVRDLELAEQRVRAEMQEAAKAKEARIVELEAQLKTVESNAAVQLKAQASELGAANQASLSQLKADRDAAIAQLSADKDAQIAALNAQLEALKESQASREQLAVAQATAAAEKERDELAAKVQVQQAEREALEAHMKEQLSEQAHLKDEIIAYKDQEIERLQDMKARLSTKMLGETLEIHCQEEFNRVRAMAFPNAYFERDTEAVEGTKGDFIYREADDEGVEIISIMFEMKNESDTDSRKKRNEDHFAKLDRDRTKKNCEYAVLVSLLEPESDLYNGGIVDVSYRYPKMYVVRPQFFLPIISLLRNGALSAQKYKREVEIMRRQDLDITHFEDDLDKFKDAFFRSFKLAGDRFDDAIEGIDKTIKLLEKIRENLTKSENHLAAANNKLEDLTVKKLTRKNPTMRAKFESLESGDDEE